VWLDRRAGADSLLVLVFVQRFNRKSRPAISARLFSGLFYAGGFGRQMKKEETGNKRQGKSKKVKGKTGRRR